MAEDTDMVVIEMTHETAKWLMLIIDDAHTKFEDNNEGLKTRREISKDFRPIRRVFLDLQYEVQKESRESLERILTAQRARDLREENAEMSWERAAAREREEAADWAAVRSAEPDIY